MNTLHQNKTLFAISWFIAGLIIVASGVGLIVPDIYSKETPNWFAQSIGQDMVNLFLIAPFLIFTSVLAYKGNKIGMMLWSGAVFYIVYTYVIYCFNIHFNSLFVIYCLILGLSFYSFIYLLIEQAKAPIIRRAHKSVILRITGIYFIVVACVFYLLWFSVIIPAIINHTIPKGLLESGLVTNPVHVLDLSVCLPSLFIIGLLVIRRKALALVLAPAMLVFCILMNITIVSLIVIMKMNEITEDLSLTIIMIMGALTLFTSGLLFFYLKNIEILPENTLAAKESEMLSPI